MRSLILGLALLGTLGALAIAGPARLVGAAPPVGGRATPSQVAVALGQLVEADGDSATLDLHAAVRAGQVGGTLRFYSTGAGFYNGGVRTLTVTGDRIDVTGGGILTQPDGTRRAVRYQATIPLSGNGIVITVSGRNGLSYALRGDLRQGVVRANQPTGALSPAPAPSP